MLTIDLPDVLAPEKQPPIGLPPISTPELLNEMLQLAEHASDLVLIPMRPPQAEVAGKLLSLSLEELPTLIPEDTTRIAGDLLRGHPAAIEKLRTDGACDVPYFVQGLGRFRASIFAQRGSVAIVLRVVPMEIPSLASLGLPPQFGAFTNVRSGLYLITGPSGSGKSTTLAAWIDKINHERAVQILTIEDPIEFLHLHKDSTVIQRELHRDVPSFAVALRTSLRYAPKVIACSELFDAETFGLALAAAEAGRMVIACLPGSNTIHTLEQISGIFFPTDLLAIRTRLAINLRCIVSQRLIEKKDGTGRVAAFEIFKSNQQTRKLLERTDLSAQMLARAMRDGASDGMQFFWDEIEKLIRTGVIDREAALESAGDVFEDSNAPSV
jgi:twitching motility protein PilT